MQLFFGNFQCCANFLIALYCRPLQLLKQYAGKVEKVTKIILEIAC